MDLITIILLGIVEGLTEFLPVSSTFHLLWTSRILGIPETELVKLFTVFIQSGAILAVVLLYWKEVLSNWKLILKLIASFIPTAVMGFLMYDVIKNIFFESRLGTTIVFIAVGGIFLLIEYLINKKVIVTTSDIQKLNYKQAFVIGAFQALAIIPGVSRAGAVLIGMMLLGFKRSESAKYSFMLSVPTIMAASLFDFIEMREVVFAHPENIWILAGGSIVAFVSALVGVKWLIKYLQNHSLALFGWYRIVLGIILVLVTVFF
ncbi:undecaprenyl-diphosphate phosphatase [Candidatus Roizmanbacteria bacterium]|nr:MAG: undecaprenyl-diphosphate phosphatase [Candidatus Roizmanbacteria bacterium]